MRRVRRACYGVGFFLVDGLMGNSGRGYHRCKQYRVYVSSTHNMARTNNVYVGLPSDDQLHRTWVSSCTSYEHASIADNEQFSPQKYTCIYPAQGLILMIGTPGISIPAPSPSPLASWTLQYYIPSQMLFPVLVIS